MSSGSTGAAVKADCYGLGVDACVPSLRDAGAREFFVAHWSEVEALTKHVDPAKISVLHGPISPLEATFARQAGVVPVINSLSQAKRWIESGGGSCHLMIDTGIHRLGISPAEVTDPIIQSLDIDILMSHLACADEDHLLNGEQLSTFRSCAAAVRSNRRSLANSAGICLGADFHFELTRPGLALYGGVPRAEMAANIRQVAFPQAAIIQTRKLKAGDHVGYNATFTAAQDMPVGVVSLGYADGYLRTWARGGRLESDGNSLNVLGKISMDMIVVDLTNAPHLKEGDWLDLPYALPSASQICGLSQYELLTVLGQRFG